jgi:hypothetical protein
MIDQNQLESVEYLSCLGSMITRDSRPTREIKSRLAMAKAAFSKNKNVFVNKLDLSFKEKTS